MDIIFQYLDWILDSHREHDKYWQPSIEDENGLPIYPSEEVKNYMKIYGGEFAKLINKIIIRTIQLLTLL